MVARPALQTFGLGVALLLASTVPGAGTVDADYVHRVEPAENGTLAYGIEYGEDNVLAYENLSAQGRQVFDRARTDSPYVVDDESATAPAFDYTSDNVALGDGLYPVRYEGTVYSLRTERSSGGFNAGAWLVGLVVRGLGVVLVVAGLVLAGYRYRND